MASFGVEVRETLSDEEVLRRARMLPLRFCVSGSNTLWVGIADGEGRTPESAYRSARVISAEEWIERLHSAKDEQGNSLLMAVGHIGSPLRIGVAWSPAGRAYRDRMEAWGKVLVGPARA